LAWLQTPVLWWQALGGVVQVLAVPPHWPEPLHLSPVVQGLLSLQLVVFGALA
jgi:hypothetical protein